MTGDAAAILSALQAIRRRAAVSAEPVAALRDALASLCGATGFAAGNVLVSNAQVLSALGAFYGASEELRAASARVSLYRGEALAGRAVVKRTLLWSDDLSVDPRAAVLQSAGIRSMVACPAGEGAGAIELFSESAERPDGLALAGVEQAAVLIARLLPVPEPATSELSDAVFRAVCENEGVGVAVGTAGGNTVYANRAYADFLGYPPGELTGRNLREFVEAEYVASTMHDLRDLFARRAQRLDLERRYVRSDGTRVWGRTTMTLLPGTELFIGVVQDIDARRKAEDAIRKLSGRFLHLQDEERRRIARALHESAAQTVAALSMNLQRMEKMALPQHAAEVLRDTLDLANQTSREIRTLSHLLHPPLLEEAGLPSSLRWLVHGFGQRSAVEVTLEIADDVGRLSTELEITLFRIVQESLTNVHRHSGTQTASVRLRRSGPEVVVEIEDRGIGIPFDVRERVYSANPAVVGVGIAGMRERLSQLGGTLEILPACPGTLVRARIRSE